MRHLRLYNESVKKDYIVEATVIDPQYGVSDKVKDMIFDEARRRVRHNNSYFKFYPCDGHFKLLSEHKDPSKAIFYSEDDKKEKNPYAYEIGDDGISDWLLSEGFTPDSEIIFLIWW